MLWRTGQVPPSKVPVVCRRKGEGIPGSAGSGIGWGRGSGPGLHLVQVCLLLFSASGLPISCPGPPDPRGGALRPGDLRPRNLSSGLTHSPQGGSTPQPWDRGSSWRREESPTEEFPSPERGILLAAPRSPTKDTIFPRPGLSLESRSGLRLQDQDSTWAQVRGPGSGTHLGSWNAVNEIPWPMCMRVWHRGR